MHTMHTQCIITTINLRRKVIGIKTEYKLPIDSQDLKI